MVPAGSQPPAPLAFVSPQTPRVDPAAFAQLPPQQSVSAPQMSPFCWQNEDGVQTPLLHSLDAQSVLLTQGLPSLLGPPTTKGAQVPPPLPSGAHLPPQHSLSLPQAALSQLCPVVLAHQHSPHRSDEAPCEM